MIRTILLICALSFSYLADRVNAQSFCPIPSGDLVLRITSTDSSKPVDFDGAYFMDDSTSQLKSIRAKTPLEIPVALKFTYGIFHKLSGESRLKLELINIDKGRKSRMVEGSGDVLIIQAQTAKGTYEYSVKTHGIKK